MSIMAKPFAPRGTSENIERSDVFQPKFDADGLIPAIVTDSVTGAVLMFAFMNEAALIITLETSHAHFWSRSRKQLWKKGEESGNILAVGEIRTDCDQDVLWLTASVSGAGVACHTGATSCFYRVLEGKPGSGDGVRLVNAPLRNAAAKS
jgi:phosphoribosyl-AMP cyclohydrolase